MQTATISSMPSLSCGVLLINLGSPNEPKAPAIRNYLKSLLSDKHVVTLPNWIWRPLMWAITHIRSYQLIKLYAGIWLPNGSPFHVYSQQQTQSLQKKCLQWVGNEIEISYALQHGEPSIASALNVFQLKKIKHLVVLPLYPQYAEATTGSALNQIYQYLSLCGTTPIVHILHSFFENSDYISALAASITDYWQMHQQGDKLLMSFHGLPQYPLVRSKAYLDQCYATAKALAQALSLNPSQYIVAFQSRFGPQKWLQPYTKEILYQLGSQGMHTLDVICPGFMVDCLETLYEIAHMGALYFRQTGGHTLRYIPCLNSSDHAIDMLYQLIHTALPITSLASNQNKL